MHSQAGVARRDVIKAAGVGSVALFSLMPKRTRAAEDDNVTLVQADEEAGFNYPYYLYSPPSIPDGERPLLVETNNTPKSTDDFDRHKQRAEEAVRGGFARQLSDELRVPLLVPAFPRPKSEPVDWRKDIQQLDTDTMHISSGPLERVDLQLLEMVEDAKYRLSDSAILIEDEIMMNGFSASGLFANRFTALHPDRVQSVTAGGVNGMPILPISEANGHTLNYQIGVADFESLIGNEFDLESFTSVDQFIYLGAEDENDTLPYNDSWSDEQREIASDVYGDDMQEDRFPYAESVYDEVGASAQFKIYEGVGHEITPDVFRDVVAFHKQNASLQVDTPTETTADPTPTTTRSRTEATTERTSKTNTATGAENTPGADGPGFGIGTAVTGLGAAGYLRYRSKSTDQ